MEYKTLTDYVKRGVVASLAVPLLSCHVRLHTPYPTAAEKQETVRATVVRSEEPEQPGKPTKERMRLYDNALRNFQENTRNMGSNKRQNFWNNLRREYSDVENFYLRLTGEDKELVEPKKDFRQSFSDFTKDVRKGAYDFRNDFYNFATKPVKNPEKDPLSKRYILDPVNGVLKLFDEGSELANKASSKVPTTRLSPWYEAHTPTAFRVGLAGLLWQQGYLKLEDSLVHNNVLSNRHALQAKNRRKRKDDLSQSNPPLGFLVNSPNPKTPEDPGLAFGGGGVQ